MSEKTQNSSGVSGDSIIENVPPLDEPPIDIYDFPPEEDLDIEYVATSMDVAQIPQAHLEPPASAVYSDATTTLDSTLISFMAALDGAAPSDAMGMLSRALLLLPRTRKHRHPLHETIEVAIFCAESTDSAAFHYRDADPKMWAPAVIENFRTFMAVPQSDKGPGAWLAELELAVTRERLLRPAEDLVEALRRKAPLDEVRRIYNAMDVSAADDSDEYTDLIRSAVEWEQHASSRNATVDRIRLSSGWPHLDLSQTAPGDVPGFFSPGHLAGFVAPSGHGKSTFVRELIRNIGADLRSWGLPFAKVLAIIVEEEPERVARAGRLSKEYAEVGAQVLIAKVNSSRKRFGAAFFQAVVQAVIESDLAGQPVREFMPMAVLLDYLQEIVESGENAYVEAIDKTTGLLRGISECDREEIEKFSGVRFADVAPKGMRWPDGLEEHRIAVIATAQVKGLDEKTLYYSEKLPIDDFTIRDPGTNLPLWEPRLGDHRVIRRGDIAGSKKFLNNLSTLTFLHRSNPRAEKREFIRTLPDGTTMKSWQLNDTRARFIFEKMRYGSASPVIDMAFSSAPDGSSAKWYDNRAEAQVAFEIRTGQRAEREWTWDWDREWYDATLGGPILPKRPSRNPADRTQY